MSGLDRKGHVVAEVRDVDNEKLVKMIDGENRILPHLRRVLASNVGAECRPCLSMFSGLLINWKCAYEDEYS